MLALHLADVLLLIWTELANTVKFVLRLLPLLHLLLSLGAPLGLGASLSLGAPLSLGASLSSGPPLSHLLVLVGFGLRELLAIILLRREPSYDVIRGQLVLATVLAQTLDLTLARCLARGLC